MSSSASLLPVPSSGARSSACGIADRSNVWAQHQLQEKKSTLDRKLHDTVVKMNVDRLDVLEDLVRMKKSASTGSLAALAKDKRSSKAERSDNMPALTKSKTGLSDSTRSSTGLGGTSGPRFSHDSYLSVSPGINRRAGSADPGRGPLRGSGIVIRVSSDWSSSEDEDHSTNRLQAPSSGKDRQRSAGHQMGQYRNSQKEGVIVENVKRRFAKQVKPQPLITENRLKVGKSKT